MAILLNGGSNPTQIKFVHNGVVTNLTEVWFKTSASATPIKVWPEDVPPVVDKYVLHLINNYGNECYVQIGNNTYTETGAYLCVPDVDIYTYSPCFTPYIWNIGHFGEYPDGTHVYHWYVEFFSDSQWAAQPNEPTYVNNPEWSDDVMDWPQIPGDLVLSIRNYNYNSNVPVGKIIYQASNGA